MLSNVRLSFPGLWKAEPYKPGDDPKFKATFLVEKGTPLAAEIDAKILAVLKEKYPSKADSLLKGIRGNSNKFCWQDGDAKSYAGYEGMMALSTKATIRPSVMDTNRAPLVEADGKPYAGCYVNASVDIFAYEKSGVGISASLRGVQFVRDSDPFSGGSPATADDFADVEDGATADDLA